MTGTRAAEHALVGAVAACVAMGVLTLAEFKGVKSLVQAGVAAGAVWCVWRYPACAIGVYLLGFCMPNAVLVGRAPLPYPQVVLPVAFAAAIFLPGPRQRVSIHGCGGAVWALLLALTLLTCASSWWGNEWIGANLLLGFAFALSAFALFRSERDWWIGLSSLAGAQLVIGLWTYYIARNLDGEGAVGHFARSDATGDVNYMSFEVGLAVVAGWCVTLQGSRFLMKLHRLSFQARGIGLTLTVIGLLLLVQFQSRGMSVAVLAAFVASVVHSRMKLKTIVLTGGILGVLVVAVSQSPAAKGYWERWGDSETLASGSGRSALWRSSLHQYGESSLITRTIGFGYGTELKRTAFDGSVKPSQISTHNSFIRFLIDQGLVGLILFVLLFALCGYHAWRRQDEIGNLRFSLVFFLLVACLSLEPHLSTQFWIVVGLCAPLNFSAPLPGPMAAAPIRWRRSEVALRSGGIAARSGWILTRHPARLVHRRRISSVVFTAKAWRAGRLLEKWPQD